MTCIVWVLAFVGCTSGDPVGDFSERRANAAMDVGPPLMTLTWSAASGQVRAGFGVSVSSAGDVNGDGHADVIVGAFQYDNGQTDEGAAFVYLGSASGLDTVAVWTAESDQDEAIFGTSVASAGDVDGDGYSDVIVGASEYDDGQTGEGAAFVYLGSAAGPETAASWSATGDQETARFGGRVSSAGDVNGDGYDDVIIGAQNYDNGEFDEGRAYVFHGSAAGLEITAAWTAEPDQIFGLFGRSAASAGDVNGDGYSDVIVGATEVDGSPTTEGRVYVYLGSASGLAAAPVWTVDSLQGDGTGFGESVASAGDVNADGYDDVLVGAHFESWGDRNEGSAYLFMGSPTGPEATASWSAGSDQKDARYGTWVASAGDVNGDGYSDVVVGVPAYEVDHIEEGRVDVFLGSATGLPDKPDWVETSGVAGSGFGVGAASAGDVDGDGFDDLVVGANTYEDTVLSEGAAFLYVGRCTTCEPPVLAGAGATPASGCAGVELGIDSPKQLGLSVTDASGVGTFVKKIPAVAQGKTMHVQAFLPDECVVTNVATTPFQ